VDSLNQESLAWARWECQWVQWADSQDSKGFW